jgi:hypothetical protein
VASGRPGTLPAQPGVGRPGTRPGQPGVGRPGVPAVAAGARPGADRVLASRQTIPPRAVRPDQLSAERRQNYQERRERGQEVRQDWNQQRREFYDDLFEPGWRLEYPQLSRGYFNYNHPYADNWWRAATWGAAAAWVAGDAAGGWSEPYDYDYGGSVVSEGDTVYVGGQAAGTPVEYAEQAMAIADSGAEQLAAAEAQPPAAEMEWMPLGVYTITKEDGGEPTRFLQLAVNKDGLIAGTYYNALTKEALTVQGAIDRTTQRAAWYAGENQNTVMEAGIYNLTEDQAPALVHFGTEKQQQVLLVRLPEKEQATP